MSQQYTDVSEANSCITVQDTDISVFGPSNAPEAWADEMVVQLLYRKNPKRPETVLPGERQMILSDDRASTNEEEVETHHISLVRITLPSEDPPEHYAIKGYNPHLRKMAEILEQNAELFSIAYEPNKERERPIWDARPAGSSKTAIDSCIKAAIDQIYEVTADAVERGILPDDLKDVSFAVGGFALPTRHGKFPQQVYSAYKIFRGGLEITNSMQENHGPVLWDLPDTRKASKGSRRVRD